MPVSSPTNTLYPLAISPSLRKAGGWLWLAAVLCVAILSLSPRFGPPGALHADKLLHALAYGGLAALPFAVFERDRAVYAAAALMLPLGFGLELAQDYIPTRTADAGDALANVIGVALGSRLGPTARRLANRWLPSGPPPLG